MDTQGDFLLGLLWGTSLSIPLWLSIFGWIKLVHMMLSTLNIGF